MIIVDTRERKWDHIKAAFDKAGIEYSVEKLDIGDYADPTRPLSVDRKQNLDELATNLCTKDSVRFWKELRNAKKRGIQLIVLCEHSRNVKEPKDVLTWKSKYSKIDGQKLFRAMFQAEAAYKVEFRFCDKRHTAQRIMEILGVTNGRLGKDTQTDN